MARDDDDDDFDEVERPKRSQRPARRRRDEGDDEDQERGDATGGLIPYKNPQALGAYYCGIFSLIPCLGLILGPIALILGVLGLRYRSMHPTAAGGPHALVGIILGSLASAGHLMVIT
ncbi:MAG: hypothetical protein N2039_13795, partial [Gemmataceae bacterium]|nr:hypothetical protein [Gemmataceae bacterium]